MLNAITIDLETKSYLEKLYLSKQENCKELLEKTEYGVINHFILDSKIENNTEALKIINYKLPLLIKNKEKLLISNLQLVYLPFWEVKFVEENVNLLVSAFDEEDYKIKLKKVLDKKFIDDNEKDGGLKAFNSALNDFLSKNFFKTFYKSISFVFGEIFNSFKWLFEKNKIMFYILLVIILVLIYVVVK